ncbi:MAG TPA: helix-turn-helix transcriptional regulator [Chloroflexota bacterium]|nr:helix-turn-helix transcriptional regulator [Chloroflexota bacterium]
MARGRPPVSPRPLTPREREILALLVDGLPNAAIAARLFITENTLEHHLTHLYAKLGVASRAQAALHAIRHQLVPLVPPPGVA